jgi:hypothetical protein
LGEYNFKVWIGSDESNGALSQPMGCGLIVSNQHVLTCSHVVRACLGYEKIGGQLGEIDGKMVWVYPTDFPGAKPIQMQILVSHNLHFKRETDYDDLCLLGLVIGEFPSQPNGPIAEKEPLFVAPGCNTSDEMDFPNHNRRTSL